MPKKEKEIKKHSAISFNSSNVLFLENPIISKFRVDLIRVILQDDKSYTLEEVQKEIDKFMKRRVN